MEDRIKDDALFPACHRRSPWVPFPPESPVPGPDRDPVAGLRAMLDDGISELDAGLGVETTPKDLMAEVLAEVGLDQVDAAPVA